MLQRQQPWVVGLLSGIIVYKGSARHHCPGLLHNRRRLSRMLQRQQPGGCGCCLALSLICVVPGTCVALLRAFCVEYRTATPVPGTVLATATARGGKSVSPMIVYEGWSSLISVRMIVNHRSKALPHLVAYTDLSQAPSCRD